MDLTLEPLTTKYIVLTHQPCRDGFVASLCARKYYQSKYGDVMPMFWGIEPSKQVGDMKLLIDKIKSEDKEQKIRKIYIESFDIAFNPDTIFGMVSDNSTSYEFNIKIYDHHRSALDAWEKYIKSDMLEQTDKQTFYQCKITRNNTLIKFTFDMFECGASLAWKYYFPDQPIPLFITYVKDRDNWLFDTTEAKERNSMEVNEYLMATAPKYTDYNAWFEYFDKTEEFFKSAYLGGKTLMDMKTSNINAIMSVGTIRKIGQHNVFVCNAPILMSDVGNVACEKYNVQESYPPQRDYPADYAMIWRYDEKCKKYCVSLRSRKGGIDVQEIAKKYNGGGHVNASGFETDNMDFLEITPVAN